MRVSIALGRRPDFDWSVLREERHFLFRRIADQQRAVLAVGELELADAPGFDDQGRARDWYFATLPYEWNEAIHHRKDDRSAPGRWSVPRFVLEWKGEEAWIHVRPSDEDDARQWAEKALVDAPDEGIMPRITWTLRCDRVRYLANVQHLLTHIQRGDIYEINYCTTRVASVPGLDPFQAFRVLLLHADAPFAAFARSDDGYVLCASPERFLAFDGRRVIGQPMKGTRPRSFDQATDRRHMEDLASDAKERSENIMALDVMRHDLSRIAASGTVQVEELCAVRSYPRVHQMVSTVSASIAEGRTPLDVLRAAFPMASMTGAPKARAMELIREVEDGPRGMFSGSLGFLAPDGTGDFNVVIRTLLFDAATGDLSLTTGSAITARCDARQEYEECQLKALSVIDALADDR
ncbi:MAG TPA: anthranilate synthase component I family protein [Flavobacteriales bacterium]|nr:anthranilate synthase component I family protein [Flavobacteriales bacterium]